MGWRQQLSRAPSMARGLLALINKPGRLGDWLGVGVVLGLRWQKFPSILRQVTVATETRSHAGQLSPEPEFGVAVRVIESRALCVCVFEYRRAPNTLHTEAAPLVAKYKSLWECKDEESQCNYQTTIHHCLWDEETGAGALSVCVCIYVFPKKPT